MLNARIGFVIPVIHPAAARDWESVRTRLEETLASVAACCRDGAGIGIVAANTEASLPPVPAGVRVVRLELPAPEGGVYVGDRPEAERRQVKGYDKGMKRLVGCQAARESGADYIMMVDADDFISRRIPDFVRRHAGGPGWFVEQGWVLPVGSHTAYLRDNFVRACGTSLIVRSDLLPLNDGEADTDTIINWLGGHKRVIPDLAAQGHMLMPLPFPAAVYRTGHIGNLSGKGGLRDLYFQPSAFRSDAIGFVGRLLRLRGFGQKLRAEFLDARKPG